MRELTKPQVLTEGETGSAGFLLLPPFSSRSDAPLVNAHPIFACQNEENEAIAHGFIFGVLMHGVFN